MQYKYILAIQFKLLNYFRRRIMTDSVTNKIILSADSTCDLDQELKERYHVHYFPLHIILDGKDYKDGIDITPEEISEIFSQFYKQQILSNKDNAVGEYIYRNYGVHLNTDDNKQVKAQMGN